MIEHNPQAVLDVIMEAARYAGDMVQASTIKDRINIGSGDTITIKDLEADRLILDILEKKFPDLPVYSEETSKSDANYDPSKLINFTGFFVDPIDGSVNFSRCICEKYGNFAVTIGYCENGIPVAGCIYKPSEKEMFHAVRGKGAFQDDIPIKVSDVNTLDQSSIEVGSFWIREELETFARWFKNPAIDVNQILIRGSAAAALADVARGRIEATLYSRLHPWDYTAGWLIIEEAGGVVMDCDTNPMRIGSRCIYATNKALNEIITRIIRG